MIELVMFEKLELLEKINDNKKISGKQRILIIND